jgi:hypothetical protein
VPQRATGNIKVDGFGVTLEPDARRLDFPRADVDGLKGEAGTIEYRAREVSFDQLRASLTQLHWSTNAASAGDFVLRDKQARFELKIARIEMPHGLVLAQAAGGGVELVTPHASLADMRLKLPVLSAFDLPARAPTEPPLPTPEPVPLRQSGLRFLDEVNGELGVPPEGGARPAGDRHPHARSAREGADQGRRVRLPRARVRAVVARGPVRRRRARRRSLPGRLERAAHGDQGDHLVGARPGGDDDGGIFNQVPLRSLADFRLPGSGKKNGGKKDGNGRRTLRSLAISDIAIKLSMAAPRHVEVGGGTILFGGDDAPGIVDLDLSGGLVHPAGPGALTAAIGVLDMTVKDVRAGGLSATCDRLHIGPIDRIELAFDGFRPVSLTASLHRVTATNLALVLGGGAT